MSQLLRAGQAKRPANVLCSFWTQINVYLQMYFAKYVVMSTTTGPSASATLSWANEIRD